MKREVSFTSRGVRCAAWHVLSGIDALVGRSDRACVVMAHGFGGTKDTGLLSFAEAFAAAGIDAFVFDFRGFGDSEGEPRQDVSYKKQREDYHAAVDAVRHTSGIDPERIALWGTSYSAGHVVAVAAQRRDVAAVIALTPATDGLVTLARIVRHHGVGQLARYLANGLQDAARAVADRAPRHVPIVGQPGSPALITVSGAEQAYTSMAGPTWRNEVCARTALEIGFNRSVHYAGRLRSPILIQVGTDDRVASPAAAIRAARKAGLLATLRTYPVDHFDVYAGAWFDKVLADQLAYLQLTLG